MGDGITLADYSMIPLEGYRGKVPFDWTPYPQRQPLFRSDAAGGFMGENCPGESRFGDVRAKAA